MNPHHHPHLGQSYHGYGHSGTATPPHLPPPLSPYGGQPFPLHQQYPSGGQVQPGMGYPPHQYQTHSGMRQSTSGSMDLSGMDREESENEDSDESESEEEEESGKGTSAGQKRKRAEEGKGKGHSSTGGAQADSGSSGTKKPKPTRGSKACTNCRRLKMRCVGAENGPPCARCSHGGHECIFEESNRGKKSVKKTEAMAKSLRKMEQTLATVLRSIRDPGLAAQAGGMVTRSPSPDASSSEDRRGALSGLTDRGHKYSQERDRERRGWRMEAEVDEHGNALAFPLPPGTDNGSAIRSLVGSHRSTKDVGATTEAAVRESMRNLASPGGQTVDPNAFRMQAAEKRPPARNGAAGPSSGSGDPTTGTRFLEPMPHYSPRTSRSSGRRGGSPRLHSLPDNTLNPLGLLAEASLHNSHRVRRATARATSVSSTSAAGGKERSASVGSSASPGKAGASGVLKSEGGGEEEAGAQNGARAETTSAAAESAGGRAGSAGAPGGEARGASRPRMGVTGRGREPSVTKTRRDEEERVSLGVASETYFKPGESRAVVRWAGASGHRTKFRACFAHPSPSPQAR